MCKPLTGNKIKQNKHKLKGVEQLFTLVCVWSLETHLAWDAADLVCDEIMQALIHQYARFCSLNYVKCLAVLCTYNLIKIFFSRLMMVWRPCCICRDLPETRSTSSQQSHVPSRLDTLQILLDPLCIRMVKLDPGFHSGPLSQQGPHWWQGKHLLRRA